MVLSAEKIESWELQGSGFADQRLDLQVAGFVDLAVFFGATMPIVVEQQRKQQQLALLHQRIQQGQQSQQLANPIFGQQSQIPAIPSFQSSLPREPFLDFSILRNQPELSSLPQLQPSRTRDSFLGLANLKKHEVGEECQAIKTENKILKQLLAANGIELLSDKQQQNPQDLSTSSSNLLDSVFGNQFNNLDVEEPVKDSRRDHPRLLENVFITPTPTISTSVFTTSYETTITSAYTRRIPVMLRAKRIISTIIEKQTQVITATEFITNTFTVTPTPTLQPFNILRTESTKIHEIIHKSPKRHEIINKSPKLHLHT
jgi:hypothetical protein